MQTKPTALRISTSFMLALALATASCGSDAPISTEPHGSQPSSAERLLIRPGPKPDCVDNCYVALLECVCTDCGAYQEEMCPWNPPCSSSDCGACTSGCRQSFFACAKYCPIPK